MPTVTSSWSKGIESYIIPNSSLLIYDVKEINEPSYIETYEKVAPLKRTFQSTLL